MLQALIVEFENLCSELLSAVRRGDENVVNRIDAEIQPSLQRIFRFRARYTEEAIQQLQFFARLAVRNCEDDDSVSRYTKMMTELFHRYLDPVEGFGELPAHSSGRPKQYQSQDRDRPIADGYDPSLHQLLLDSLGERIAVVGLDYRYIYTNKRNADFHGKSPSHFVGKHLGEMIDPARFDDRAKPKLDKCFSGETVEYSYRIADLVGQMFEVDCRMTPFVGPDGEIAGAVIVLNMHPSFARVG
ncbi:PAS domain-containing protein [Hoeflea sp.]|uniref:PAS domain-containing protein n=1 Tax=Hoeflea sp. TaxID=1940281 RepID=UPI003B51C4DC